MAATRIQAIARGHRHRVGIKRRFREAVTVLEELEEQNAVEAALRIQASESAECGASAESMPSPKLLALTTPIPDEYTGLRISSPPTAEEVQRLVAGFGRHERLHCR